MAKKKRVSSRAAPRKKPAPRKKIQRDYDLKQNVLTLTYPDGTAHRYALLGLNPDVYAELAMRGAADILAKKADPDKTWEEIKKGIFGRNRVKKHYPLIVRALSLRLDVPEAEAQELYDRMTGDEKKALRTSKKMAYWMAGARINAIEQTYHSMDELPADPVDSLETTDA